MAYEEYRRQRCSCIVEGWELPGRKIVCANINNSGVSKGCKIPYCEFEFGRKVRKEFLGVTGFFGFCFAHFDICLK